MKVFGVTAEFNPFHSGHRRLAEAARTEFGADFVVAVMSGNYVQRGTPAVFDKWKRAEQALDGGYDLVLELPAALAVRHGGDFARYAVDILAGTGIVTDIIFGSETGDTEALRRMAESIDAAEEEKAEEIRKLCKEGLSYPAARARVIPDVPAEPNDILGAEYIRALSAHPGIGVHTIKRDTGHHESAAEIRQLMLDDPSDGPRLSAMEERWFDLVRYAAATHTAEQIDELPSGGEGLGNRILKQLRYAADMDGLTDRVKSKRYARTRIQRLFCQLVLGISRAEGAEPYIRVLAAGPGGRMLLREMNDKSLNTIPVVSDPLRGTGDPACDAVLRKETEASDIYSVISGSDMYRLAEMVRKPSVR
ncbi:MAG: nucleotidyltransferase family protein [Eubacterium sp.]|nr:nucleotidyltransferase family protein [Eubacterium sp.]